MSEVRIYDKKVPAPMGFPTDLRGLIREHLNHADITLIQLAQWWGVQQTTARRMMYTHRTTQSGKRERGSTAIKPHMLDVLVRRLKLDEFDAAQLYRQAALEAGYKINLKPDATR